MSSNAYRDKLVEAMARAIAIAAGWPIEMWDNPHVYSTSEAAKEAYYAFARAALDAALGVLAEPSAEMVEAGGEAALEAYGSASGFISMEDAFGAGLRAMLATLGDV